MCRIIRAFFLVLIATTGCSFFLIAGGQIKAACTGSTQCEIWNGNTGTCGPQKETHQCSFKNGVCQSDPCDYCDESGQGCEITGTNPTNTPGGPAPTTGGGGGSCAGHDYVTVQVRRGSNQQSLTATSGTNNQCDNKLFQSLSSDSGCTITWNCQSGGDYATLDICNTTRSCPLYVNGVDSQFASCSSAGSGSSASFSGSTCSLASKNYNSGDTVYIDLQAPAGNCSLPQISSHSRSCSGTGLTSVTLGWQNTSCSAYRVQYSTSSSFNTNTAPVYQTDVSGTSTTVGNLDRTQPWSFRVACKTSSSCTPVMSGTAYTFGGTQSENACPTSNAPPTGAFTTSFSGDIANNTTKTFVGECRDAEGKVTKARLLRSEKPLSGGSWATPSWTTSGGERLSATGTSPLSTGTLDLPCSGTYAQKSHRIMVECEDLATLKCSGDPDKSWNDCGNNDYKVVNCLPPAPSATPIPTQGSNPCPAPANLSGSKTCNSDGTANIVLSWNASTNAASTNGYYAQISTGSNYSAGTEQYRQTGALNTNANPFVVTFPNQVHYAHVRVQNKSNSASCNVPGNYSANITIPARNCTVTASPTSVSQVCAGGCAGPSTFSVTGACEANGYDATLTWRKSANVTTYRLIYDNDANVDNDGSGSGYVDVAASASGTNQSYTFDFADDVDRWFYVRSYAENSTSCTVDGNNAACYSSKETINAPVCLVPSATPVPNACTAPTLNNTSTNCNGATKAVDLTYSLVNGCTNYELQKANNNNFSSGAASANDADGTYSFTGLTKTEAQYFRVRCSAKTNSASCTVPGNWSAVRSSAACSGPSPTTTSSFTCGQNRPSNTSYYTGDDQPTSSLNWAYAVPDTNRKCQYYCNSGFTWDGNSCEPDVQTRTCGQSCDSTTTVCDANAGLICRNSICRSSSCANNQQNASCVCQGTPTNTPAPASCAAPSNLNCGGSCNSSGQMTLSCTFTRDPRVTGFTVTYDENSGFSSDSNYNTSVSGSSASVTYDATTTFPNQTHWYKIKNRTSDGSCVVGANQYTNTVSTGPASCTTYSCTNVRPSNSSIHADDEPPTGNNLRWAHSTTDSNRQCEFYCNTGYTYNATANTCEVPSYSCGGTRPANTLYYSGDNAPSSSGSTWAYSSTNTGAKCEYFCDSGYQWNSASGACVLPVNACAAPVTTAGAITCANDGTLTASWNAVSGASTYRYQRNTSASTTGAVFADISGTSFSVPIGNPSVNNYFRVRVQSVAASATCTDPGNWSAWRTVNANASCAAPTATPVVTSCVRPTLVTVTESCNPSPQIGASWNKVSGVLRYEYQIKRASDVWADSVFDGEVTQPLGTVNPVMPAYFTEVNPPDYNVRVRSVCSDGSGGEVTSPTWRTGTSNFVPPACGGPTVTPVPPAQYDVTVNLRVTEDNVCLSTGPNEDLILNDPFTSSLSVDELGYVGPTLTPMPITSGTFSVNGLHNTNNLQPRYTQFSNNEVPGWTRAVCQNPVYATVYDASDSPVNFYLSPIRGPWWQSSFGDVYGNILSSTIPTTATNPNLSISSGGSEAGAVVWNSTLDLSTGSPSQKGYRVGNQALPFQEDFAYFESKLGSGVQNVASNDINAIIPSNNGIYRLTGNQTLSSNWNVTGKIVIMIDNPNAQLVVQGIDPISIGSGGFIFFVVNGPINFSAEVDRVFGMFMAQDDITVLYDVSNQDSFVGHGSFISTNGNIVSNRSLAGNDNNTDPATEFIYEPGLVLNTPNDLKTNTTVWQEVAP